ncbi:MAG: hypothetical protein R3F38_11495 [Gammaproteobacteria bacterium]
MSPSCRSSCPTSRWTKTLERLCDRWLVDRYNLRDQGYLAGAPAGTVVDGLSDAAGKPTFSGAVDAESPAAPGSLCLAAAVDRNARDSRVRSMLEVEAFSNCTGAGVNWGIRSSTWCRPLATALGSSVTGRRRWRNSWGSSSTVANAFRPAH